MPFLVQLLLPVTDNEGAAFPPDVFAATRAELVGQFGGVTAYLRAPARGLWQSGEGVDRDDLVMLEVMVDTLDREWWGDYRNRVGRRFRQEELVIRSLAMDRL